MDSRKFNTLKGYILGGICGFTSAVFACPIIYINNYFIKHVGVGPYTNCFWTNDSFIPTFTCSLLLTEYTLVVKARTEYAATTTSPYWGIGTAIGSCIGGYLCTTPPTVRRTPRKTRQEDKWDDLPLPESFIDPITMKLMRNPIITCTMHNEKITLYDYKTLAKLNGKCPYSRYRIIVVGLDRDLKKRIKLFIEILKKSTLFQNTIVSSKRNYFCLFSKFQTPADPLHVCPITGYKMKDPVKASDGHTYERKALLDRILKQHNLFSPVNKNIMLEPMSANSWVIPDNESKRKIAELAGENKFKRFFLGS